METTKVEKTFYAVKMMLDIRTTISNETQNMTYIQLKAYIQHKIKESKLKPLGT